MNQFGISFIIPCYNSKSYLVELVNSILSQNLVIPYEINVVNDGVTSKETLEALRKVSEYDNVNILNHDTNLGSQFARNSGLRMSKYKYILPMDSDDKLNTDSSLLSNGNYPESAIKVLENSDEVAFVHCTTMMFGDFDGLTQSPYPLTEALVAKKHHVSTWIVYRREDALNAGGYDEEIIKWQDWSFGVTLLNYRLINGFGNDIHFLKPPYVMYRNYSDTNRISFKPADELNLVRMTIEKHPEIFLKYNLDMSISEIVQKVYLNRPNHLTDLLFVARYDIDRAIDIVEERGYFLVNKDVPDNTP